MHEGIKVVSPLEMKRVEEDGDHESFMARAGSCVAQSVISYQKKENLLKKVTIVVGKGNNGGDGYAAGIDLLDQGYEVKAYPVSKKGSALSEKFKARFLQRGGKFTETIEGIVIDALLGTGFQGKLKAPLKSFIEKINDSKAFVISIDIPSGVDGTSGFVQEVAVKADVTVSLGLLKTGLFLNGGWEYVGEVVVGDFGLSKEMIAGAEATFYVPKTLELPPISRVRHKYEAGYVVGYGGSKAFSGAPQLASLAALRTGAGIVRLFSSEKIESAPLELITEKWSVKNFEKECQRASALFIGPGLGSLTEGLKKQIKKIKVPTVFDADALMSGISYPKGSVLTPHRKEALRLLGRKKELEEKELFSQLIRFCNTKELSVVLKGAPTFIFGPNHKPIVVPRGDPGMATAGTGDVLTGVIAALIAQGCSCYEAAILGVCLHSIAGEFAAETLSSYSLIATDVIAHLPKVYKACKRGYMHCIRFVEGCES